jgi:hypothetical protein
MNLAKYEPLSCHELELFVVDIECNFDAILRINLITSIRTYFAEPLVESERKYAETQSPLSPTVKLP